MENQKSYLLSSEITQQDFMYLTRNEIETSDSRDLFGSTSFLGSFYQMGKISVRNMHSHVYPGEYLRLLFYMTPETINH